ncbi:hypothetical protein B1812_07010 [Methylocystis bryophila]|uniref:Uncharacterized protein n=1 Tax=Methylocystis bryophila TaxID=655015 RepID=A0A1W6MTF1_9HYPH|nr:hypothetical protein B1812_07010 [Methylocystis bryophila]
MRFALIALTSNSRYNNAIDNCKSKPQASPAGKMVHSVRKRPEATCRNIVSAWDVQIGPEAQDE